MLKNQVPRLRLADLIRRRRTTLKSFVNELGLTTYTALGIYCQRVGVLSPSVEEFDAVFPPAAKVNSPKEGVVVLEAPPVISESTGLPVPEADEWSVDPADQGSEASILEPTAATQKKPRRKKVDQPTEA